MVADARGSGKVPPGQWARQPGRMGHFADAQPQQKPEGAGLARIFADNSPNWAAKKPLRQPVAPPLAHDVPEAAP